MWTFYLAATPLIGATGIFVKRHDAAESLLRAKREGKVHHAGFSFHASFELFQEILDATDEWDFCRFS